MPFSADSAETLALKALGWLAGNDELLPVFLGSTGASESDLREQAADPAFLGSVLDFLTMDDAWLLRFAADSGLAPEAAMQARAGLPGGEAHNWT